MIPHVRPGILLLVLLPLLFSCTATETATTTPKAGSANTIAFGSCLRQWNPQPVWKHISALSPRAFIFLGDNMYADVGKYLQQPEPERIGNAYRDLGENSEFEQFITTAKSNATSLYATWDDHDYGANDGGGDYPYKLASKRYFLDFFAIKETAAGDDKAPGIYQSHRLNVSGLDIQLILLDTRSFRSPLARDPSTRECLKTRTVPNTAATATVLGNDQWQWLRAQLLQPADMRIIASSIQVIPQEHCFEKWANFPLERQRLFDLIRTTRANGVVLISGDRHLAELSVLPGKEIGYPLYEITASGLNSAMGATGAMFGETNRYRVRTTVFTDNFGAIAIGNNKGETTLTLQLHRADGTLARDLNVPLRELSFH